jgi:hypothetical protein
MNTVTCTNCSFENLVNSRYCSRCGFALPIQEKKTEVIAGVETPKRTIDRKKISGFIGAMIGVVIGTFLVNHFFNRKPVFDEVMIQLASEINQSCPIMVDGATRLDNVAALPDKVIQYNYTLILASKDELDEAQFLNVMKPKLLNNTRTNPEMKIMRDNKATLNYFYKDKNGIFFTSFKITPEMYATE